MPPSNTGSSERHGFDPEALRKKYLEERDKRLRKDGLEQYVVAGSAYGEFANDPYVEPGFTRAPVNEDVDVVIMGGGLGGLMSGADLRKAGINNFRIIEQGGDFGGTWYWNRYPGIRCDIESYIYMPLLEEVGTIPAEKYETGFRIHAHCQAIGRHFDLYPTALFQTDLRSIKWDETSSRWIVKTSRNDVIKTRFVISGSGNLHRPKLPGIPGIQDFKGHAFHTSRWDYAYTGGSQEGNLSGLKGKRVAVIGTGATTIQLFPHVAETAKHVYLFQRTPSAVDVRNNSPTDIEWFKNQKPGWHKQRIVNFASILNGAPQDVDLVNDGWTDFWQKVFANCKAEVEAGRTADLGAAMQLADFQKMEEIRARIDTIVKDPQTASSLKPWYNLFCKRPLYSDDYLPAFNRPNVTLVDTQGRGIDRINESSIVFDGTEYEIDCVIFATGFQLGAFRPEDFTYELAGRTGVSLAGKWTSGIRSLHGVMFRSFPNFFLIGGLAQASLTYNYPHVGAEQANHIALVIRRCLDENLKVIEVSQEAEDGWVQAIADKSVDRAQWEMECTPGYYNNEGDTNTRPSLFGGNYGGGPFDYVEICREWRTSGFCEDLEITPE